MEGWKVQSKKVRKIHIAKKELNRRLKLIKEVLTDRNKNRQSDVKHWLKKKCKKEREVNNLESSTGKWKQKTLT